MTFRTESAPTSLTLRVERSHGRATPEPAERNFREFLREGAHVLLDGVESATTVLPGGAMISAAVRSARSEASGIDGADGSGGEPREAASLGELLSRQADSQMYYLELQQRIQDENRRFTTLSNVLKARHETAKTAIGNIR